MRDIAFTVLFAFLIGCAIARPWIGLLVWSWISYMSPHHLTFGFAYHFPYVAITAGVTIVGWYISHEPKRFPWTVETVLEIILCLWISFTTLFALSDEAGDYLSRALKIQVMIFMTLLIIRSRYRLEALVWTIVVSIGIYGVKGGLFALATGGAYRVQGPNDTFITGNNEIGLALVIVLPLMRYLQLHASGKWTKIGLVAAQILTTLAVISTYSRGGLIALSAVGLLLWMKSRHKLFFALALFCVVAPLVRFMPAQWNDRMGTIQNTDEETMDASARGRLNAWAFAWNLVKDRPWVGGGFRVFISPAFLTYAPDPMDIHDSHSIYFEVLGQHGFPGLAIFLALGLSTWVSARRVVRRAKTIPGMEWVVDMVGMSQIGLAGYCVGGALAGLAFFDLPYHLMAIIVICKVIVNDELRSGYQNDDESTPSEMAVQTV